jgi:hypothetical protein
MYGKLFDSTFTGSMYGAGSDVFAVWGYVVANTVNSSIELNPAMLAAVLGTTPEAVRSAIAFLCSADPNSRNPEEDGKRLIKEGMYQYRVVSHELYRAIRDQDERRAYNRVKQQEHRQKRRQTNVIDSQACQPMSAQAEAEAEAEAEEQSAQSPRKACPQAPGRLGGPRARDVAGNGNEVKTFTPEDILPSHPGRTGSNNSDPHKQLIGARKAALNWEFDQGLTEPEACAFIVKQTQKLAAVIPPEKWSGYRTDVARFFRNQEYRLPPDKLLKLWAEKESK